MIEPRFIRIAAPRLCILCNEPLAKGESVRVVYLRGSFKATWVHLEHLPDGCQN
jgi:hypothetical protein